MEPTEHPAPLDLSVVLTVCDDEDRVGKLTLELLSALRALMLRFEVLVVDEGSGDNTLAILALCQPQLPEVTLVHAPPGRGLWTGAERARGRALLLLTLDSLAAALEGSDLRAPLLPAALRRVLPAADGSPVDGRESSAVEGRDGRLDAAVDDLVVTRTYLLLRRSRSLPLLPALAVPRARRSDLQRVLPGVLARAEAAQLSLVRLERGAAYTTLPPWLRRLPLSQALSRAPRQQSAPGVLRRSLAPLLSRLSRAPLLQKEPPAPPRTTSRLGLWRWPFDWLLNRP